MSAVAEILERLEAAEVGSRLLDGDICQHFGGKLWGRRSPATGRHQWMTELDGKARQLPAYTTSIDAALALAARVVPGANCFGFDQTPKTTDAYVSRNCVEDGHWIVEGVAATPALALCIAVLKARTAVEADAVGIRAADEPNNPRTTTETEAAG